MIKLKARLFLLLQFLLPRYLLTAAIYHLARVRQTTVKNLLISGFTKVFAVNTAEVDQKVPDDFVDFNAFFTRELREDARPVANANSALVSPVDGTVSEAGVIERGRLLQAKGLHYELDDLLATDLADTEKYVDGQFATIYLAPYNYHRIHAPQSGRLVAARYVPGELFSVNPATVGSLRNLFARNERLVCHFETDRGPMAVIFVGALNVGSISTPWTGEIRPRKRGAVEEIDLGASAVDRDVRKGDLLGWFNMGSTVILLLPPGACEFAADVAQGKVVQMGEALATFHHSGS